MEHVLIALGAMLAACLAVHLGLPQAIAGVVVKICKCPKCCTFWATLGLLTWNGCDLFIALVLSVITAYLSHWVMLVLGGVSKLYDRLWLRLNQKT